MDLSKNPADDDHRVRPHDVDHRVATKLRKVVGTDDRILVTRPHVIHSRLELDEIVNVRSIRRPIHLADDPAPAKPALGTSQALEYTEHLVLIKSPISEVHFRIGSHLELSGLLCFHPSMPAEANRCR